MEEICRVYKEKCLRKSDINEHLPTLSLYARECNSILETGVRGCVSSWALAHGLLHNSDQSTRKYMLMNDIRPCDVNQILDTVRPLNIDMECKWMNDLNLELERTYDLVFIDTWHVYGQLRRELDKFGPVTNKYIIMHDTTVDAVQGETIRMFGGLAGANKQSVETGIPVEEIMRGIWPAVEEFLEAHNEWTLKERYANNNGLTILKRLV